MLIKNKLYAFGCSFTDSKFVSPSNPEIDCSFPKWPEILGKKLGKETVNLGRSGAGNDSIYNSAVSSIINYHKEIDTICVLWSNVWRYSSSFLVNPTNAFFKDHMHNVKYWDDIESISLKMIDENYFNIWISTFYGFLYNFQNLQTICKEFDIRLVSWCGTSFLNLKFPDPQYRKMIVQWYDAINDDNFNPRFFPTFRIQRNEKKSIDEKDIIGWPFVTVLGGNCYSDITTGDIESRHAHLDRLAYRVSDKDWHPNADGHELIANVFLEQINVN